MNIKAKTAVERRKSYFYGGFSCFKKEREEIVYIPSNRGTISRIIPMSDIISAKKCPKTAKNSLFLLCQT